MNIVLVRQGEVFPAQYVTMLNAMLKEHAPGVKVWTLTDRTDTPGNTIALLESLPGWWAKMEIFAPWNHWLRPFIYFDLDTYVLGDISDIVAWKPGRLAMLSDFYNSARPASGMMFVPDYQDGIWERFTPNDMHNPNGDQGVIGQCVPNALRLQDCFAGIRSYKVHGPDSGRVICFHGQPKPHSADPSQYRWIADVWQRYG